MIVSRRPLYPAVPAFPPSTGTQRPTGPNDYVFSMLTRNGVRTCDNLSCAAQTDAYIAARTITFCEFATINRKQFKEVLNLYPEMKEIMRVYTVKVGAHSTVIVWTLLLFVSI